MSGRRHDGRTAVVTGAAMGLGRACAQRLAHEGATVVLADLADAIPVQAAIAANGGRAVAVSCDVADQASVARLAEAIVEQGGADILVHNAGIYPFRPVEEMTFDEWRHVMAVNLDSMFLLCQAVLPGMRERGWGRIVGMSSAMVHAGIPGALHYVASKGGIIGFVRALSSEVGMDGVTVNAIAPGLIRTEGTSQGFHDGIGLFETSIGVQSVKRTGVPSDIEGVVSFLGSDEASFITGQVWVVDGGYV